MNTSSYSDIKIVSNSIWKKPIRVSDNVMVVVIHESIVRELEIDEGKTWFEQIPTKEGILLRISSKKIEPSHDVV